MKFHFPYGNPIAHYHLWYNAEMGQETVPEVFLPTDIARIRGPIVYCWVKNSRYIYIGMSCNGLARPLASGHTSSLAAISAGAELHVYYCQSEYAARKLERYMIVEHDPELNGSTWYRRNS